MDKTGKEENKDKKELSGIELLNAIVSETLCRHQDMTSEEYLKCLEVKNMDKTEQEIVNTALYNLFIEICKESIKLNRQLKGMKEILDIYIKQHNVKEIK